ncbi:hypothetical protein Q8A67_016795 [Cirrhinus molitorella]|uniref:Nidogen and EGF-like domain-containing n=1 Tax=Cirrhinus molitorella TaxID=172907 RepID=A0AA88PMB9_9TELE|nr:hypothetical protein Q8A67_016795 [Cirrhinus molitorella]
MKRTRHTSFIPEDGLKERFRVNNNGYLTFTEKLSAYNPYLDFARDIIAPLWTHLDNRHGGTVSYREDTSSAVLAQVTGAVKQYFPNIPFAAATAFVATWDSVPYYNGGGVVSFQVVLAYNVHRSFILIYYGDIAETGQPWQAGYNTVDSVNSFTIPGASVHGLSLSSNINATACWSFHVDGSPISFVATWDSVPYYNGGGVATFQVVLVSSVHRSFILLNYGHISETEQIWQAGYSTVDSVNSFTIPVTSAPQLSSSSNINVNGRCSFHVDGAPNLPTNFLPSGDEEIVNPPADDGSSGVIFLQQPFKYFGRTYNQIFVNNNGYLTFTEPLSAYNSSLDSARDIIAPLWTRLDNRHGGTVSYREDTSSAVLAQVTGAVKRYFPNIPFDATTAFVATWDSVPYHSGGGLASFQVVLAYNVHRSFILIYYGDIAETGQPWQAGYNTVDSVSSFTIPAASVPELSSSSNINVTACWSFHVDGSPFLPANFLPFGNGEIVTPRLENGSSGAITLQQPFKFFGRTHNQTFVKNDGHLTFTEPLSDFIPLLNSGRDIIAPLWTHLDNRRGGTISCREDTSSAVLAQVTAAVQRYFPNVTFAATSAFVATWDSVPYYNGRGVATFQVVLVSSVHRSFILLNYGHISETEQIWQAGYSTVDSVNSFTIPVTSAPQLSSSSNINVNGRCSFHVDGAPNLPTNFLASGDEEIINPPADDGSSGVIFLQQPFKYFGRIYNQIFVNNNGYLTFTEPLSAYNSSLDSARDIIAPLWTRLDNRHGGTVSYREDTSSAVLAQVTGAVKRYFPNIPFDATTAFVATFQVVLVSSVHRSFILLNYGHISETEQIWQVMPTNFLPSGDEEIVNPPADDGSSGVIFLQQPFKYFGRTYNQIFVNNNGYLTFTEPLSAYNSSLDSARDIIAPLWTRLDNRHGGTVSYREDTSSAVLAQVTGAVKRYFPNIPFDATTAFVATWDSVPYHSGGGLASFQVVLAYNVHRSFILIYYGDIAETGQPWQAGYNTVDSVSSFTIPAASVPELSSSSNINVTACWSFHVDGSPFLPANFLPFGNGEIVTPRLENGSSGAITLQQPFKFFGRTHNQTFVKNDGHLTFTEPLSDFIPLLNSGRDIIAPLWTHLDNRRGGTISCREDTSSAVLAQVTAAVQRYFPNVTFAATSAFVATWDSVPYYNGRGVATFQVVLVSSVHRSFILLNYGHISETEQIWQAGYSTVDSVNSFTIPVTSAPQLSSSSNINVNGRCSFHVDGAPNLPTNFLASGDEEIINPPADDGSSGVIFLQQPFKYFGRIYNQIFVNNNGYLTFTEPLSAYNSSLDSARDIIAPLWTRLDNRHGGTVSYREDTSSAVLAQVTGAVKQYFPNIPFDATTAFVATWDSVPYHSGGGLASFQVVLAYNVHRSFILIYYGDIAETGQPWQAGYNTVDSVSSFTIPAASVPELSSSSNINVTACWSFHVDGSPFPFVATWDSVPYFNGRGVATFQVVLVSSVHRSFILLNYGHISETEQIWQAGYSTVDSVNSFTIPVTSAPQLSSSSNINVNGRCSFHVDGAPNLPTNFLPSGDEEIVNPPADDGSSGVIFLQQPFKYFGRTYNQIFVNNNGYLTFTEPLSAYNSSLDSARDIIAPLWTRLDNRHGGTVSYREDTSSAVLAQVTGAVKQYFPNIPFDATTAFVATWDSVPYHSGGGLASFQVVLAYNVHRSFILIYYGDIAETGQPWQAGYNTVDSVSSFTIPAASVPELSSSSNINVTACWSFHVDGSPFLPANFLPFGNGEIVTPRLENGSSGAITLQQPFKFFGRTHNQTFVNNDGHLTFTEPLSGFIPLLNSGRDIIAPLWTHLDNRRGGTISCREDTSSAALAQVTAAVQRYFPNVTFAATSAFVATWDSVPYYNGRGVATFQVVLVSSVHRSFILLNYGHISETEQIWQAGYSTVDSVNSFTIPVTSAPQLSSSSNINVNGRCSFHVDGAPNLPTNFLPSGDEEIVNPPADDGSSGVIFLQQPFKYFGRTYNQIFVNNNGYLTFTEPLSAYNSSLDSARDIIAPLWTRLDNRHGGTVSYREDTSSAVLAQVTGAVKQYFPNIPFDATTAFVATFQVVLVSSVHRSFILLNYGHISETEQIWQVMPTNFLPSGDEEIVNPPADDGSSGVIFLQQPFKYFGRTYNQIFVNNNGYLTFTEPLSAYNSSLDSARDIIAPLWTRLDNRHGGTVSYREETSSAVLAQVTGAVKQYFPNIPFDATTAFVATWDSVPYHSGGGLASFQVVLAYNVHRSFILIYYGDIAETGQPWQAGYNTVDSVSSFTIPAASVPELSSSSNINVTACWSFHVDGSPFLPANFLPFGNGEIVTPRLENGSSGAITLQQPFKFFGRTHNQTFVNNDGHLTFTEPLSDFIPLLNSGRDIIAPLWTHLDNRRGGTISCREDTSSAVLAQVTAAVQRYFPNVTFAATSAFVATWDSVPYYNGRGVATFQVVLVSSVHRSFILLNYGHISETEQIWQAGYSTVDSVNSFTIPVTSAPQLSSSSNINVNGRCSFHVDGAPNLPTNFLPSGDEEIVNPPADDGSSGVIFLQQPFKYFGRTYNQIFVNNNGYLTFTEPLSAYNSSLDSARDIIAPLWTRLDNRHGGTVSYREETSSAVLAQVTGAVKQYFPNIPFDATTAFVATWDSVPYHSGGGLASFQVVLAYNVHRSFILIYYGDIAETGQPWQAGYNTVDSVSSFTIPAASVPELSSSSNINVTACWSFHVDGSPFPFVATWDSVPYYNGRGVATFQVVLVSSVHRSFILLNYGHISETEQIWQAGYSTVDSVNSFTIPVTSAPQLSSSSNINVNGRCSFHVDGAPNLPTNFLPSGDEEIVNPPADDGSSGVIFLQQPFKYFGRTYNQIFVNNNGYLTFTEPLSAYNSSLDSARDIIAPLWTRLDNRHGGTVSYREDTSSAVLAQVTGAVKQYFPNIPFDATTAFVATWDSVPYHSGGGLASFQVVLAYNVHRSFILIYYGDIAETGQPWQAGYNTVDSVSSFTIPAASVPELSSSSNINVTACWSFHVDGSPFLPANFLPFGNGEIVTPRLENGSSGAITLQQPFKFFGRTHNQTFVNNEGHLTFTEPLSDFIPLLNSGRDIIAPLWTHLDNRRGGTISCREDTSSAVLAQVTAAVQRYFPNVTFAATSAFVATWDSVPYYNGRGVATFQVVLVSSVHRSFILLNYGHISETEQIWQAGYSTVDSVNSFTIPVTSAPQLSSSSNINVNGRCSFHVDGAPNLPTNFLPSGDEEIVNPPADDGSSGVIFLQQPFKYFGRTYNQIFVNNNGYLTFTEPLSAYNSSLDSARDIIAPLWTRLDNRHGGTVSYREDTSSAVLAQVTGAVKQYFPNIPFDATTAFVATFQVVLVSSVHRSFILLNYGHISETEQIWQVMPTNFLPSGDEEIVNPPADDGSSGVIFLQQPFKYFGRTYNQIFVNNNGYLTFTEPLSAYNSSLDSARDIIAPLWTRLDNRHGGTVSYREDTSSAVLAQVTGAVKQYFPNIPFDATTAFVATWDSVPYHSGGGLASFQVVLAYNVHRSFILIYYGDIAETGQPWQAGYNTVDSVSSFTIPAASVPELSSSSNINVTACWSFHVDGSPFLPANFLPFGNGEIVTPRLENGSSGAITLQQPFKFFGRTHNQTFVNNEGHLTFTEPLSDFIPLLNSGRDIIAPLWTHLDNRRGGTISCREDTSSAVLAQVTAAVQRYFPNVTFAATSAFVATWDSVPYYNGRGVATFQVVLVSSVHRSFILLNYGHISETEQIWQAGYSTVDSVNSFTIPVTSAPQLSSSSNINVNGRCSFHVDGAPNLPTNFLPSGDEEIVNPPADDGSSGVIFLQQPFKYFGRTYNQIFVNNNGYLTFTEPLSAYNSSLDSARDIIAPLWTRLDNRHGGTVSYREDTSSAVLAQVTGAVKQYFPNIPFDATTAFVATWDSVPYHSGGGLASFQVVLAYNVHRSFILIYYGDIAETGQPWQAGYNTVDSVSSFTIPAASVPELSSSSNINVTACWSFHVDGSPFLPANFLPFGNGEIVTPRLENGSSGAITLQQPFKFFGRTDNQTFVNNDGHLTFTEPLSDFIPLLNSGRDIIAPLWTHLDNRRGGTISCREDTSSAVLAQVTAAVQRYFPNVTFAATSAFVATWDSVPYYNGRGVATFQVVLVSSVHRSFILLNYGHISETEQIWQAGYSTVDSVNSFTIPVTSAPQLSSSSNINVNGRCSFHVDGAPNLPTNFLPSGDEEIVNPPADDGSSGVIFLQQPFKYFGRTYNQIFVNNNGYLTFTEPLSAYNSSLDSARDIIAPLWTRLDNRHGGTVSYREETSSAVLAQVTGAVKQYFPNIPFDATTAFVATWDSVPYHSGGGLASFQVVLAYNVHRSFILIYYGDIAETGQPWQAGYNTVDSVSSFTIPAASVPELSSSSNINVTACWSFHVDGSPFLPANFLPFGNGEIVTPRLENGSSGAITLQQPFKFFGRTHNQTFVNNDGHLTFTEPLSDFIPLLNSGRDIIAPLWTHLDNRRGGTISCREDTSSAVLAQVTAAVQRYFPNVTFAATSAFVATWDSVPYYNGRGVATFQVVLVSSVHRSFILLNYGHISETEQIWQAGYSTVDSVNSFTIPVTSAPQLSSSSNINVNGRCSFHVDGAPNLPTNFLPSVDEEIVNPPADDGSSGVIFLQQPFKYFGRTYNQIFVNNNGYLTFTEPLSAYNSSLDSARDIIAPLWTRLDNRHGGTVSYREETSSAVLAQVTGAVKQYFPNIPFDATTAFVATWDSVPYHSGGGLASFQVVLAYNVHRSFILIYYGDIAETGQPWQVNNNGHLTFTEPLSDFIPLLNSGRDIIAPLWTHLDNRRGGTISCREDTSSAVLAQVTAAVQRYFPNVTFAATSAFVATWDSVPYYNGRGVVTFQVVLTSNGDHSFILFNYGILAETRQRWLTHYETVDFAHSYNCSLLTVSELSSNSNVNVNGRWVFHVYDVCDTLDCHGNEVCHFRDGYGCGCLEGERPNPETFDAMEFCAGSTGTISLSRCQLFESGFPPEILHLNDPNCKGISENGRVLFHFDNEGHVCGSTLSSNGTHFIYQNTIQSTFPTAVITRERWINISFSCAYPLIQTLSMPKEIHAEHSVLSIDLPSWGTYQIRMIPYHDAQFIIPYEGNVEVQVNQQMYVEVEVEGVDRSQIATVLDNCWATPVNDIDYQIRWNLIVRECPNPEDGTVEVLRNGIDTSSRFSFRMFTFTRASDQIFLHCQMHLCLVQNGRCAQSCNPGQRRRRRRYLDFHHSAAITMGLKRS